MSNSPEKGLEHLQEVVISDSVHLLEDGPDFDDLSIVGHKGNGVMRFDFSDGFPEVSILSKDES